MEETQYHTGQTKKERRTEYAECSENTRIHRHRPQQPPDREGRPRGAAGIPPREQDRQWKDQERRGDGEQVLNRSEMRALGRGLMSGNECCAGSPAATGTRHLRTSD